MKYLQRFVVLFLLTVLSISAINVEAFAETENKQKFKRVKITQNYEEQSIIDFHNDLSEIEAIAAYLAMEAERIRLEEERNRIPVDWARWERLHNCEQAGNWYANGRNPADPARQVFQGGLGMSTVAWQMAVRAASARGVILPSSALSASPEQQMIGAQAFYDAHGWGWSCKV